MTWEKHELINALDVNTVPTYPEAESLYQRTSFLQLQLDCHLTSVVVALEPIVDWNYAETPKKEEEMIDQSRSRTLPSLLLEASRKTAHASAEKDSLLLYDQLRGFFLGS